MNQNGNEQEFPITWSEAESYSEATARAFFGKEYENKNITDARFESGVANEFLAMSKEDREKVARAGPITAAAIRRVKEKTRDPLKFVSESLKEAAQALKEKIKQAKKTDPKYRGKNAVPVVIPDAFANVTEKLDELVSDDTIDGGSKGVAVNLRELITLDADTAATVKSMDGKIKDFNKKRKEGGATITQPEIPVTKTSETEAK